MEASFPLSRNGVWQWSSRRCCLSSSPATTSHDMPWAACTCRCAERAFMPLWPHQCVVPLWARLWMWTRPGIHPLLAQAGRPHYALCELGWAGIWPCGWVSNRNPFPILFFLNLSLNFENSYLSVYCSKNYETSFVGFIISRSMHKEYQIE
jgi:hypothetical protein